MAYRGRKIYINIRKAKDNFDKDKRPKYFNWNMYEYIAKEYWRPKKKWEIRKYNKYDKVGYLIKNRRSG